MGYGVEVPAGTIVCEDDVGETVAVQGAIGAKDVIAETLADLH